MRLFLVLVSPVVFAGACISSGGVLPAAGGSGDSPSSIDGGTGGAGSADAGDGQSGGSIGSGAGGVTTQGSGGITGTGGGSGRGSGGNGSSASGGSGPGGGAGHASGGNGSSNPGSGGTMRGSGGTTGTGGAGHPTGGGSGGNVVQGSGGTTVIGTAGNPNGSCSGGVPASGKPADVSSPTTVVGTGTSDSCTLSALKTAVGKAGVITFDCGTAPVTIAVTSALSLSVTKDTVIDGGNKVTLDGGHASQIFNFAGTNFQVNETRVTLQHLNVLNGQTMPTKAIPTPPQSACSQGYNDGEGGAIYMRDGNLTVIDCVFSGNQSALLGPDTGGGAIYMTGSKHGAMIVSSTFNGNSGSNAGAVGGLFAELDIYNSLFQDNTATGHDANTNDQFSNCACTQVNNGQHECGSGGNGGAIYADGNSFNITLCGDAVLNNVAGQNAFGGGLFFTSDDFGGVLTIIDTTMTGNTGKSWTSVNGGSVTNAGSAVAVNAKSIVLTNSTMQM